jgi:hypothetical protein
MVDSSALARRLVEAFPTSRDGAIDRDVAVYMAAGGLRALNRHLLQLFARPGLRAEVPVRHLPDRHLPGDLADAQVPIRLRRGGPGTDAVLDGRRQ